MQGMSPSAACATPGRGAPDAFGAARLLHEKAAGHSCRRRAKPDLHIATGAAATAIGSLGSGASPGEGPANSRPTSGRNTSSARRRSNGIAEAFHDAWRGIKGMMPSNGYEQNIGIAGAHHNAWRGASVMPRPLGPEGKSLTRTTWPSPSTTGVSTAKPHEPKPSTPDSLPWEGRQLPANARHSDLSLRGRAKPEDAARRFRVLQGRLILVGVRDNRVEAGGEQNSVNKSTGRTHFIVPLSTERPTRARLR